MSYGLTIVQESSPTYAAATVKFLEEKDALPEDSPAFQKMKAKKAAHYSSLIQIVQTLVDEKRLLCQPSFLFPVVSSLGFLNKDMNQMCKLILQRFKEHQDTLPRLSSGITTAVLKGRFKVHLKNAICFAILKGNALAIHNQGVHGGVVSPP